MILAGIDIGTNTLRLLVADIRSGSFREIHSDRKITRLGQSLDRTGLLSDEAQRRSISALAQFSAAVKDHHAVGVSAVGTSALRNAANSAQFISAVKKETGLDIRVISGEDEARFTVLGVSHALWRQRNRPDALVVDIGGGSTEIIELERDRTRERSLALGSVYLTERFIKNDPPNHNDLSAIRQTVLNELKNAFPDPLSKPGRTLTGTAGTITTLAAIEQELTEYDPARINGFVLSRETVERIVAMLAAKTIEERRCIKGLEAGREDIVLAGALVVEEMMDYFGFSSMLVSDWGLREGIVFALHENMTQVGAEKEW